MSLLAALVFPHPVLTPIASVPTNTTLQRLQRELYANATSIHSPRGGGAHGHLAVVLTPAAYQAHSNTAFDPPEHPGTTPIHAVASTAAQITETNRQFRAATEEHRHYLTVVAELRRQVLAAVHDRYVIALSDPVFGYTAVTIVALLAHLHATYGLITPEQLEENRAQLSAVWDPTSEGALEDLWTRTTECQALAERGLEPIQDQTIVRLLLSVFEQTGVLATACERWRERDSVDQTLPHLKLHFVKANRERLRKLTAGQVGYHGANAAQAPTPTRPGPHAAHVPTPTPPLRGPTGKMWYYCHTHGLSPLATHTSPTCQAKGPNHEDAATLDDMLGGCRRIHMRMRRSPAGNNA